MSHTPSTLGRLGSSVECVLPQFLQTTRLERRLTMISLSRSTKITLLGMMPALSIAMACETLRGNPSRMTGVVEDRIASTTMSMMRSSGTNRPDSMKVCAFFPRGVCCATSFRMIFPVARMVKCFSRPTRASSVKVPWPAPLGPMRMITLFVVITTFLQKF